MGHKSLVCLNIAVIGKGKMTHTLARCFANAGHNVFIGNENYVAPGDKVPGRKFDNISETIVESAAIVADLIIIASPMDEVRGIAYKLGDIRRKVLIDATAFGLSRFGQYAHTLNVLKTITGCQHIVKCYNKTGYEDLVDENLSSEDVKLFMAGDSKKAKELTKLLARELEIGECHDFGGSVMIGTLDEMTMCWNKQNIMTGELIVVNQRNNNNPV